MPMKLCFEKASMELCQDETPSNVDMIVMHKGWYVQIMDWLDKCLQEGLKDEAKPNN